MIVLQLRHENVSNCELSSSDLLLSIASPQSGQCRIGGRSGAGIGTAFSQPQRLLSYPARLHVSPVQCGGENAKSSRDECNHNDLCCHRMTPLLLL